MCLNAGVVTVGLFDLLSDKEVESMYRVNMLHPVYLAKALLSKQMSRQGRSAMILTSSGLSLMPMPSALSYSSTKAAVSNFF